MAREFNGTDQALVASSVDLSGVQTVTVSFWGYFTDFPNATEVYFEFSPDQNGVITGFLFFNDSTNTLALSVFGDVDYNAATFTAPSTSAWHHYALIMDKSQVGTGAAEVDLYIDGSLKSKTPTNTGNNTNNFAVDELNFMSRNGASLWRDGRLAEVGIWNTRLTGGNITSLAGTLGVANSAALPSSIPTGLKGYWALLGTTSPEPDTSGAGNNAALVGTPTPATHPIEPNYATGGATIILARRRRV